MEFRRPHADLRRHPRCDCEDGNMKDSGIETSRSAALNVDMHRRQQKHSVNWKLSKDGSHWLGHLVLHKDLLPDGQTRQLLGMRVVGDQQLDKMLTCAIVQDVKEGSLADRVGHIRPGDEILEWNGTPLQGESKERVNNIIALSKNDSQVQLILTRRSGDPPPSLDPRELRRLPPPHLEVPPEALKRDPHYLKYSDRRSSDVPTRSPERSSIGGRIQVALCYDQQTHQLIVTVIRAKHLLSRNDTSRRNPYIKIVLLLDKSENNKRRTKAIGETNDPQFNQRFFFHHVRETELKRSALQISAWDYDSRNVFNDFLGEVVIRLGSISLNDVPEWYTLSEHTHKAKVCGEITHMSPTGSRMSDKELFGYKEKSSAHTGVCSEHDRFLQRRGGGSLMAAALGVGTSRSPVSSERTDSEKSSEFSSLSSAFHRRCRTIGEFTGFSSAYGGPVHLPSREIDDDLSDTVVGLATKSKAMIRGSTPGEYDAKGSSPHLSKKTNSTSKLSLTGHKWFSFWKSISSSFVARRSEEILRDVRTDVSFGRSISGDNLRR